MRTEAEIRERIEMALVEVINSPGFMNLTKEPENVLPRFVEQVTNKLFEITMDEIVFRRRF